MASRATPQEGDENATGKSQGWIRGTTCIRQVEGGGRASAREGSHSLGGHGLLLEGDEGHPQRPLLDPALLLRDPLGQPVLQARVVSDGVLLPADTPPR